MAKRRKNELEEVMEMLKFYNAREITKEDMEKNPKLKASIEADRKWLLEHTKLPKKLRKELSAI